MPCGPRGAVHSPASPPFGPAAVSVRLRAEERLFLELPMAAAFQAAFLGEEETMLAADGEADDGADE